MPAEKILIIAPNGFQTRLDAHADLRLSLGRALADPFVHFSLGGIIILHHFLELRFTRIGGLSWLPVLSGWRARMFGLAACKQKQQQKRDNEMDLRHVEKIARVPLRRR